MYAVLFALMYATFPAQQIVLYLIILIIFGGDDILWMQYYAVGTASVV
jgi:hypothetical protein